MKTDSPTGPGTAAITPRWSRWNVYTVLALVPTILVALLLILISPLLRVRFGELASGRIGHFAANTEIYLCERDAGLHGTRNFDFFYHGPSICNRQLQKMWDRSLPVFGFANFVHRVLRRLPGSSTHEIPRRPGRDRDIYGLLSNSEPHISFTAAEEELGRNSLIRLGVPEGSPFVCFHARDTVHLDAAFPGRDWRYQDHRNSSIHNYLPGVEYLTQHGYYALRTSAYVEEPLGARGPGILDYATEGRSDFLDIYLGAKCRFFICDTAGISTIPMIFRRPIAWVNYVPLELAHTSGPHDLFIPKKIWFAKEDRFLSFKEILRSDIGTFALNNQYDELGLEVVENSPQEIAALVKEMDSRLDGSWAGEPEDEELQKQFWSLFRPNEFHGTIVSRIGADFLRKSRTLLE